MTRDELYVKWFFVLLSLNCLTMQLLCSCVSIRRFLRKIRLAQRISERRLVDTVKVVIRHIRNLEDVMWTAKAESMTNFAIANMLNGFACRLEDALRRMGVEVPADAAK